MEFLQPGAALIIWTLIALAATVFTIAAIVHLLRNKSLSTSYLFLWFIIICGLPFIGSVAYFITMKKFRSTSF